MASTKTNVRVVSQLSFKDGSIYSGQVYDDPKTYSAQPYGYGLMQIKDNFIHSGYFKYGKAIGKGRFKAPNGDIFYGNWNTNNKRHGKGLFIRSSDQQQLIEEYDEGKLLKRVKRRPPNNDNLHWIYDNTNTINTNTNGPGARTGHTMTVNNEETMIIVIGGQTNTATSSNTNNIFIYDIENNNWLSPQLSGDCKLPSLIGHTATLLSNNHIIIIGGQLSTGLEVNSNVYSIDLNNGTIQCIVNKGVSFMNHTATLINKDTIVVIVQSSVFTLNLKDNTWTEQQCDIKQLKRAPRSFISHTAISIGNMIYVYGGKILGGVQQNDSKKYERCTNELRILHTDEWAWECPSTELCSSNDGSNDNKDKQEYSGFVNGSYDCPRCSHSATLIDKKYMCIIGGYTTSNPEMNIVDTNYLNDIQILDCETLQWINNTNINQLIFPVPRSEHSAVYLKNKHELWIYGGINHANQQGMIEWEKLNIPHNFNFNKETAPNQSKPPQTKSITNTTNATKSATKTNANASVASTAAAVSKIAITNNNNNNNNLNVNDDNDTPSSPVINTNAVGSGSILDMYKSQYK